MTLINKIILIIIIVVATIFIIVEVNAGRLYRGAEQGITRSILDEDCFYVYGFYPEYNNGVNRHVTLKTEAARRFENTFISGVLVRYEETQYGMLFETDTGSIWSFNNYQVFRTSCL